MLLRPVSAHALSDTTFREANAARQESNDQSAAAGTSRATGSLSEACGEPHSRWETGGPCRLLEAQPC